MTIIATNITTDTMDLLHQIFQSKKFTGISLENGLDLNDNTVLMRLSIINLLQHPPSEREVEQFEVALSRPKEFDRYLKKYLKEGKL